MYKIEAFSGDLLDSKILSYGPPLFIHVYSRYFRKIEGTDLMVGTICNGDFATFDPYYFIKFNVTNLSIVSS